MYFVIFKIKLLDIFDILSSNLKLDNQPYITVVTDLIFGLFPNFCPYFVVSDPMKISNHRFFDLNSLNLSKSPLLLITL